MKNMFYFLAISFCLMEVVTATAAEGSEHKQKPSRFINGGMEGKVYYHRNEHDLNVGIDGKNNRGKKLVNEGFKDLKNPTTKYFYGDSKKYNIDADDDSTYSGASMDGSHHLTSISRFEQVRDCVRKNIPITQCIP
ncbi:hypothetical protein MA16_Dca016408 [Dendrobium catenatum]|uniref:Uncharacterized protein n=1 Tax=Dendrobium catenatum TaxID=906689 RepID=A0A2I0VVB4_9ASPA|nr:hypothetical protein MA16_Dca016408 [Dendrobium catenatum]